MYRTVIGLILAALTGVAFYLVGRTRYKCPYCGRTVKWSDELCPHCGDDMKFQHRAAPTPRMMKPILTVRAPSSAPPSRRRDARRPRTTRS